MLGITAVHNNRTCRVYIDPKDVARLEPVPESKMVSDPHVIIVMRNGERIKTYTDINMIAKEISRGQLC